MTGVDPFYDFKNDGTGEHVEIESRKVFEAEENKSRSRLIKATSEDFAKEVADESLDFVFIDGDHSEAGVLLDLKLWTPKVRKHGVVAGHDLFNPAFDGV